MAECFVRIPMEAALTWAASRAITGRCWRVLMVVLTHADKSWRSWPGPARIARLTGIDEADVRDALNMLVKEGVLMRDGTVPTERGPANVWRVRMASGRDGTPGGNALPTPGAGALPARAERRVEPRVEPRASAPPKQIDHIEQNQHSRSRAMGWDDVLKALKSNGFKIDDPVGMPDAHNLIESLKSSESNPTTAYETLKKIVKRPNPSDDPADFFDRQRKHAKDALDEIIADAVKASNERYYAACPSNLVRSKIHDLNIPAYHHDERKASMAIVEAVKTGRLTQTEALAAVATAAKRHNGARLEALRAPLAAPSTGALTSAPHGGAHA